MNMYASGEYGATELGHCVGILCCYNFLICKDFHMQGKCQLCSSRMSFLHLFFEVKQYTEQLE